MAANQVFGTCRGPNSEYICLISSDGHEFVIKKELALRARTIRDMVDGPGQFDDGEKNELTFRTIPSRILRKICTFFAYQNHYQNPGPGTIIPEFRIDPEDALAMLMAASLLDA